MSDTIETKHEQKPALSLTIKSKIYYQDTLDIYVEKNPYRNDLEKILISLKVQVKDKESQGTIVGLGGKVGENRDKLLKLASASISKEALKNAPDEQRLVILKFRDRGKSFEYAMSALRPVCNAENAPKLGIEYGSLLKHTKINYQKRQELLSLYKKQANIALSNYGLSLNHSINTANYNHLFLTPSTTIEETLLLFGNQVTSNKILTGLSKGGVFRRHKEFLNPQKVIQIAVLKIATEISVGDFLGEISRRLKQYKFDCNFFIKEILLLENLTPSQTTVEVEKKVNEIMEKEPDLVLVILPKKEQNKNEQKSASLYEQIYAQLLRRRVASQFIYEDTLQKTQSNYILNQVIPGILAKLGNIPFVLAEELKIADIFLGFDISRSTLSKKQGSLNACASIRLYGKQGEFSRYQLESDFIEGEEIPARLLERLLPRTKLYQKTVLIYRDGLFRGNEVNNFLERAEAIDAKFILVECIKSGTPRLYQLDKNKNLTAPPKGLALKLSSTEAILVTTQMSAYIGIPRPLRLKIHPDGKQAKIEDVIDTTLKLTLLHHGALKSPRLPMPLHGADKMAGLRLKGIYPSILEDDRQFWL